MQPAIGPLFLLALSTVLFAVGGGISLAGIGERRRGLRPAATACLCAGTGCALGVIVWHSLLRGRWLPINDNFDALVWLAVLLALFVAYTQIVRPVPGLDWFVMPIVILLLAAAAVLGRIEYHQYHRLVDSAWLAVHRVTTYVGSGAFAVAAAGGAMYLLASRRLRSKSPPAPLGSLERLDAMMLHAITLGFALLTVGMATGFVRMFAYSDPTSSAKVVLASFAWLAYAVVLHAPVRLRYRSRRTAILSLLGFVLVVGTIIAAQLMPGGKA